MDDTEEDEWVVDDETSGSNCTQQTLPGLLPICTAIPLLIATTIIAVFFLAVGVPYLTSSVDLFEHTVKYSGNSDTTDKSFNFTIDTKVEGPVYAFYQLDNYYQNNRRFFISRDYDQLGGESISDSAIESCDSLIEKDKSLRGNKLCGIGYAVRFNDAFTLTYETNTEDILTDRQDIVTSADRSLYSALDNPDGIPVIAWLKSGALPSFRKPIGVIPDGLEAGSYTLHVKDVYTFTENSKSFVLAQRGWFGSQNNGFGILLVVLGAVSAVVAILLFIFILFNNLLPDKDTNEDLFLTS